MEKDEVIDDTSSTREAKMLQGQLYQAMMSLSQLRQQTTVMKKHFEAVVKSLHNDLKSISDEMVKEETKLLNKMCVMDNETNTEEEALRAEMKKKDEIIERLEGRLRNLENVRDDMNDLDTVYEEDEGETFFAGNASKNNQPSDETKISMSSTANTCGRTDRGKSGLSSSIAASKSVTFCGSNTKNHEPRIRQSYPTLHVPVSLNESNHENESGTFYCTNRDVHTDVAIFGSTAPGMGINPEFNVTPDSASLVSALISSMEEEVDGIRPFSLESPKSPIILPDEEPVLDEDSLRMSVKESLHRARELLKVTRSHCFVIDEEPGGK